MKAIRGCGHTWYRWVRRTYCADVVSLAGLLFLRGSAPPARPRQIDQTRKACSAFLSVAISMPEVPGTVRCPSLYPARRLTSIEEVDGLGYSSDVGRLERSVKVLEQAHGLVIEGTAQWRAISREKEAGRRCQSLSSRLSTRPDKPHSNPTPLHTHPLARIPGTLSLSPRGE